MKNSLLLSARGFLHLAFIGGLVTCVHANVTTVAWYRLGENDPGAATGLAITATTTDLVGVNHLKQFGGPIYTNAASPAGSSLAVQFNGTSQYLSNALVSTAVNNFGIEAWVKPDTTNAGFYAIALNGFTFGGWGMYQNGGNYLASFPFLTDVSIGPASLGTWVHLAFVCDNGTVTTYRNGIAIETLTLTPLAAAGGFSVGAYPLGPLSVFNGAIDEVRVFIFVAGHFSTNDLLFNWRRVSTLPATGIASSSATLNGSASPLGQPTGAWFEWGTTTNYGNITPVQMLGSGSSSTNFSQVIGGLIGGAIYHFRAGASNGVSITWGVNQSFTPDVSGQMLIRRTTNGLVELTFGTNDSAYLMEASTNLSQWNLISCVNASSSPERLLDLETDQFAQRFYRYRTFPVFTQTLFYFFNHDIGWEALFRTPSFSSSTTNFLDSTAGAPNFVRVTSSAPSGGPATNVLHASWVFKNGVVDPWLRLTTFNAGIYPNPTIDFSQGFAFEIYADCDLYLALGLRETITFGVVGEPGGTTGPIEWVGGTVNNSVSPPRGRLITAGQWQRVCFWVPDEPVRAFTGNGVLTSPTGMGVFEHLALVPVNYVFGVTNHVYLGNFQTVQRLP